MATLVGRQELALIDGVKESPTVQLFSGFVLRLAEWEILLLEEVNSNFRILDSVPVVWKVGEKHTNIYALKCYIQERLHNDAYHIQHEFILVLPISTGLQLGGTFSWELV